MKVSKQSGEVTVVTAKGHIIGLIKDSIRYVNADYITKHVAPHQTRLRDAWGDKVYTLTTTAGIMEAAGK